MSVLAKKKVLITCGPTWIPIDNMRVISNRSTGEMGSILAQKFKKEKANITLLQGPIDNSSNTSGVKIIKFNYFNELLNIMNKEIKKKYDIIVHAAAVSDYMLEKPFVSKIKSDAKKIVLTLIPTEKIINRIKKISPKSFLVGFKLESKITKKSAIEKTKKLFKQSKCDLAIANSNINGKYKGFILDKSSKILAFGESKNSVAQKLISLIKKNYS